MLPGQRVSPTQLASLDHSFKTLSKYTRGLRLVDKDEPYDIIEFVVYTLFICWALCWDRFPLLTLFAELTTDADSN